MKTRIMSAQYNKDGKTNQSLDDIVKQIGEILQGKNISPI
jgi:hypothetical protein